MTPRHRIGGYREYDPSGGVAFFCEAFWTHHAPPGEAIQGAAHRVLPDPAVSVAFWAHRDDTGRPIEGGAILIGAKTRPGLVVARQTSPARDSRDLVYARTIITSTQARRVRLVFGYSDAAVILLNGRAVFEAESRFRSRDPGFLGVMSLGPDAIDLDLAPGRNELVFAVSETFGGWGLAARIE